MTLLALPRRSAAWWRTGRHAPVYSVRLFQGADAIDALVPLSAKAEGACVFQRRFWLEAWYREFAESGTLVPLVAEVSTRDGVTALVVPFAVQTRGRVRVAVFADEGVSDYNGVMLGPAAPTTAAAAAEAWRVLLGALPAIDVVSLRKMPLSVDGRPNPLALLRGCRRSVLEGHDLRLPEDWSAYHSGLERRFRKELERSWRVFARSSAARFEVICSPEDGSSLLDRLAVQQRERMAEIGEPYLLDDPPMPAFYRRLVRDGVTNGNVILTRLVDGDVLVAALLGVRSGATYTMVRISNVGGAWSHCSPGRLLIHRTMAHVHSLGVRVVDFSIGTYAYKRRFGTAPVPLVDRTEALTLRGMPYRLRAEAIAALRHMPWLDRKVRRLAGVPVRAADRELDQDRA